MSDDQIPLFGDAPPPAKKKRDPDLLFEALMHTCSIRTADLTASGRGMANRALKELRDAGASPPEVLHRGQAYRERFSSTPTPGALARHWASLAVRPLAARAVRPSEETAGMDYIEREDLATRARAFMAGRLPTTRT